MCENRTLRRLCGLVLLNFVAEWGFFPREAARGFCRPHGWFSASPMGGPPGSAVRFTHIRGIWTRKRSAARGGLSGPKASQAATDRVEASEPEPKILDSWIALSLAPQESSESRNYPSHLAHRRGDLWNVFRSACEGDDCLSFMFFEERRVRPLRIPSTRHREEQNTPSRRG